MSGFDLNASLSSSSSATSGAGVTTRIGNISAGGGFKVPVWVWAGVLGVGLVLGVVFLVRR